MSKANGDRVQFFVGHLFEDSQEKSQAGEKTGAKRGHAGNRNNPDSIGASRLGPNAGVASRSSFILSNDLSEGFDED